MLWLKGSRTAVERNRCHAVFVALAAVSLGGCARRTASPLIPAKEERVRGAPRLLATDDITPHVHMASLAPIERLNTSCTFGVENDPHGLTIGADRARARSTAHAPRLLASLHHRAWSGWLSSLHWLLATRWHRVAHMASPVPTGSTALAWRRGPHGLAL
jgi:hypothetical protein